MAPFIGWNSRRRLKHSDIHSATSPPPFVTSHTNIVVDLSTWLIKPDLIILATLSINLIAACPLYSRPKRTLLVADHKPCTRHLGAHSATIDICSRKIYLQAQLLSRQEKLRLDIPMRRVCRQRTLVLLHVSDGRSIRVSYQAPVC